MNSSQLTLAEKSEIKNSVCGLLDFVISQSSSSKAETYMKKFNPAMHTKHKWLSDFAEKKKKTLLGLHINVIIILAATLP